MKAYLIFILICVVLSPACKKYQNDDPSFHLKSVRNRIVGKWTFEKTTNSYTVQFTKDGRAAVYTENSTYETIWEVSYDKQRFYFRLNDSMQNPIIDSDFYLILRLDNQELWLSEPGSSTPVYTLKRQ